MSEEEREAIARKGVDIAVVVKKFVAHLEDGTSRRIASDTSCSAHVYDGLVTIDLSDGPFVIPKRLFDSFVASGVIVIEQNVDDQKGYHRIPAASLATGLSTHGPLPRPTAAVTPRLRQDNQGQRYPNRDVPASM